MKKLLLVLIAGTALLAWACTFQVRESEAVIVTRFGDPQRTVSEPGLHFKWPAPVDLLVRVDGRVHVLDPEASEYLTRDKKNLMVNWFAAWSVADPERFVARLGDTEIAAARLQDAIAAEVGSVLGAHDFEDLVSVADGATPDQTALADVNREITELAGARVREDFGVELTVARVKRLNFPTQSKQNVFRRMQAERQRIADELREQGREEAEKLRSDANLEADRLIAEAEQEAVTIEGEARARALEILNQAQGSDRDLMEFLQLLDTLESALDEDDVFVLPPDHWLLEALGDPSAGVPEPAPEESPD